MLNINLRKFKEKDLENVGRCVVHKIIPVVCAYSGTDSKAILNNYIRKDMKLEIALAIVNPETDVMLGGIDSILIDDVLLTSYYVLPYYQNHGICTKALGLFIEYIRKNNSDIKQIQLMINKANIASRRVASKCGFSIDKENEFVEDWYFNL